MSLNFLHRLNILQVLILSKLSVTKLKREYKNVYRTIQKFNSLKLVEETTDTERKRYNEKFFKLRDEEIYLLFLKRLQGIYLNQILVQKGESPVSYIDRHQFHI
jgi:hypothetical protein